MSILKSAVVEGLWDDRKIAGEFDPHVNFLIGVNGSGKTTVLSLIAAALSSDFEGLSRSSFSQIDCVLLSRKNETETRISVSRSADELSRFSYQYTLSTTGKPDTSFILVNPSPRYLVPPIFFKTRNAAGKRDRSISAANADSSRLQCQ